MPRQNRTFTADDVIRVYMRHLNEEEMEDVEQFFGLSTDLGGPRTFDDLLQDLDAFLEAIARAIFTRNPVVLLTLTILGSIVNVIDLGGQIDRVFNPGSQEG